MLNDDNKKLLTKWCDNLNYMLLKLRENEDWDKQRHLRDLLMSAFEEVINERDRFWSQCLKEHRDFCRPQGNKHLTRIKRLMKQNV